MDSHQSSRNATLTAAAVAFLDDDGRDGQGPK